MVTQGSAPPGSSTHRYESIPFRRNWAVAESRADPRDERPSWRERMGLTVEDVLDLAGLAGTAVAAGATAYSPTPPGSWW